MLVATIGVAELAQAIALLPVLNQRTGSEQTTFPSPITNVWHLGSVTIKGPQLLVLIIVPVITVFLWWLLGHTAFGESVRASATNADLARLTGVSPKMMSTAIWTIAGFLSSIAVILYATQSGSPELVTIGPETLLLGLTAALIGKMTSFPRAVVGAIFVGILYQVLFYNFPNTLGARAVRAVHPRARSRRPHAAAPTTRVARASRSRRVCRRYPSGCARSGGCGACRSCSRCSRC